MMAKNTKRRSAFTLLELMFVCGIIALVATIVLPSIISIFNSGADAQAYNVVASQLSAARALAMRTASYTAVHIQAPAASLKMNNALYIAILRPTSTGEFGLAPGFAPIRIPSGIGFAVLNSATIDYSGNYIPAGLKDPNCTTFTFIYAPTGELSRRVNGRTLPFDPTDPLFLVGSPSLLWDPLLVDGMDRGNGTTGATACTMFDWGQYTAARNTTNSTAALSALFNEQAMFLPVNMQTGQLYPRR